MRHRPPGAHCPPNQRHPWPLLHRYCGRFKARGRVFSAWHETDLASLARMSPSRAKADILSVRIEVGNDPKPDNWSRRPSLLRLKVLNKSSLAGRALTLRSREIANMCDEAF